MSSPIAQFSKSLFRKSLIYFHKKASHSKRIEILSDEIIALINELPFQKKHIKIIDIGCGDMKIAEIIEKKVDNVTMTCLDIHPLPDILKLDERWKKYRQYDGKNLPFKDLEFDVAIFCDSLHHEPSGGGRLLSEGVRVAKYVIIKDVFEYGFFSRKILQLMDIVGNWAYGVYIPKKYFTKKGFNELTTKNNMKTIKINIGVRLYNNFISIVSKPNLHFLAILTSQKKINY